MPAHDEFIDSGRSSCSIAHAHDAGWPQTTAQTVEWTQTLTTTHVSHELVGNWCKSIAIQSSS